MKRNAILGILACAIPFCSVQAGEQQPQTTITVTGTSCVKVVPDLAIIRVSVVHRNKELAPAKQKTDEGTRNVLAALKDNGIDKKNIQTEQVSIQQLWEYNDNQKLKGYEASQTLTIILQDLAQYDSIIPLVLEAGATNIHSVEFQTSTPRKYKDKARQMALTAAREKANDMAAVLGQRITHPTKIMEQGTYSYSWNRYNNAAFQSNISWSSPESYEADENLESLLAPGEIKLTASVTVTFAFESDSRTKETNVTDSSKQQADGLHK